MAGRLSLLQCVLVLFALFRYDFCCKWLAVTCIGSLCVTVLVKRSEIHLVLSFTVLELKREDIHLYGIRSVKLLLASPAQWFLASGLVENLDQVEAKITLRPTVSRPVSHGVKPHLGPKTRFSLLSDIYVFVDVGCPLWREDGSVTISSTWHLYLQAYLKAFCIVICQGFRSLWTHIIDSCICNSSIYVCTIYTRP
jgi:hypothetical protein